MNKKKTLTITDNLRKAENKAENNHNTELPRSDSFQDSHRKYIRGQTVKFDSPDISKRIKEKKYDIHEWIMIRSFTFSLILVLLVVMLSYFIYVLLGDYVTVILFSIVTGLALHPYKIALLTSIRNFLGISTKIPTTHYYYESSLIVRTYQLLRNSPIFRIFSKKKEKSQSKEKAATKLSLITTDLRYMTYICGIYALYSKISFEVCVITLIGIIGIDIIMRLLFDLLKIAASRVSSFQKMKMFLRNNRRLDSILESSISALLLVIFVLFVVGVCFTLTMLLVVDLNDIVTNARVLISEAMNWLKPYIGNTAFQEEHLISFIQTYNESISSFLENTQLKNTYNAFSSKIIFDIVKNCTQF